MTHWSELPPESHGHVSAGRRETPGWAGMPAWLREKVKTRPPSYRDDALGVNPACAFCVALDAELDAGALSVDLDVIEREHGACTCEGFQ